MSREVFRRKLIEALVEFSFDLRHQIIRHDADAETLMADAIGAIYDRTQNETDYWAMDPGTLITKAKDSTLPVDERVAAMKELKRQMSPLPSSASSDDVKKVEIKGDGE